MKALEKLGNRTGGTLIEYAFIAVFTTIAVTAMATYISRGIASKQNHVEAIGMNF